MVLGWTGVVVHEEMKEENVKEKETRVQKVQNDQEILVSSYYQHNHITNRLNDIENFL